MKSTRDGFGEGLLEAGKNKNVWVVTANLGESTRANAFAKKYPKRFIDVGVAEQNMIGIAAGLASTGKTVVATSFAAFSPGRSFDQIRVSVALNKLPVIIVGSHAGLTVGEDGATHQALEDLALMRSLPGMTVLSPADFQEARELTKLAIKKNAPCYLRLSRQGFADCVKEKPVLGKAAIIRKGKHITLCVTGPLLAHVLEAAELLAKQGISCEVINYSTIKPFDSTTVTKSGKKTGKIISFEEHQTAGGLGSAIAEHLTIPIPLKIVGVTNRFGTSGTASELLKKFGLDVAGIVQEVIHALQ